MPTGLGLMCPKCGDSWTHRSGERVFADSKIMIRIHCISCGRWSYIFKSQVLPLT